MTALQRFAPGSSNVASEQSAERVLSASEMCCVHGVAATHGSTCFLYICVTQFLATRKVALRIPAACAIRPLRQVRACLATGIQ